MIRKNSLSCVIFACTLVMIGCSGKNNFKIEKGRVGQLTAKTTMQDLDKIFKNDSIVKNLSEGALGDNYFQDDDAYIIYEKGGKHLLTITPKEQLDSVSTIKSVEIYDARFKTDTGLNLNSSFSEINANNNINRIESTISSATLFIDDYNVTIAIDKEELGLKNFNSQKVSLDQIPDLAKMKSFIVWFN
ncbi:MAG: hypothetical protein ACWIPI_04235 [Polaribacter sp.]